MGVKQSQRLAAVNRVVRLVDVERDAFGNLVEGYAIKIDPGAAHAHKSANVRQILQPRDRRLRTLFPIGGRTIERHLEHRIAAQAIGVDAILVAGADHQHAKANDVGQTVCLIGCARIGHAGGVPVGKAKAPFDLAQRQNAAIRLQQAAIEFDHDGLAAGR